MGLGNACCRFELSRTDEQPRDSMKAKLQVSQQNNSLATIEVFLEYIMSTFPIAQGKAALVHTCDRTVELP